MIIRKIFFDFEAEEKWLNTMAKKGLSLVKYTFWKYEFEETEPNKYLYRIQLLDESIDSDKSIEYLSFMKETGIDCIGNHLNWVYFRKENCEEGFELYSDNKSKLEHYKKVFSLLLIVLLANTIPILNLLRISSNFIYVVSLINLVLGVIILIPTISIYKKIQNLKEECNLFD